MNVILFMPIIPIKRQVFNQGTLPGGRMRQWAAPGDGAFPSDIDKEPAIIYNLSVVKSADEAFIGA